MAVNVRLKPLTLKMLDGLARRKGVSRSDVVREAIEHYGVADAVVVPNRPHEAWADVIGTVALGARDVSRTTGEQFATMVAAPRVERPRARRSR